MEREAKRPNGAQLNRPQVESNQLAGKSSGVKEVIQPGLDETLRQEIESFYSGGGGIREGVTW